MWEVLTEGAIGVVLLLDNTRPDPFADMRFFVERFSKLVHPRCFAIGVTRFDVKREPGLLEYSEVARTLGLNPPIFELDARLRRDVSILLRALLYSIDPQLQAQPEPLL
jgi:signal recognition particle receptor subunit beta